LTKNYRSHKSIFEVSSKLFYGDAIEQYAEEKQINSLSKYQLLPKDKPFPVLFIGEFRFCFVIIYWSFISYFYFWLVYMETYGIDFLNPQYHNHYYRCGWPSYA
jgi:hypothetical protein